MEEAAEVILANPNAGVPYREVDGVPQAGVALLIRRAHHRPATGCHPASALGTGAVVFRRSLDI